MDFTVLGDIALGAVALAGVRSLRQGLSEISAALAARLEDHEVRLVHLEALTPEHDKHLVGFQVTALDKN